MRDWKHQTAPANHPAPSVGVDLFDDENPGHTTIYIRFADGKRTPGRDVKADNPAFKSILDAWTDGGITNDYRAGSVLSDALAALQYAETAVTPEAPPDVVRALRRIMETVDFRGMPSHIGTIEAVTVAIPSEVLRQARAALDAVFHQAGKLNLSQKIDDPPALPYVSLIDLVDAAGDHAIFGRYCPAHSESI